jgi:O-Antigen ligase/Tetratricopeptide repeat
MVDRFAATEAVRVLPAALMGMLLVVSVWWDSAFDLRYWAPLTLLALGLLLALLLAGVLEIPRRGPLAVATVAVWCFAAYVLFTAAWGESVASAWAEAARTAFYASLWTLAVAAKANGKWRNRLGAGLAIGVGAVAVVTLLGLLVDGTDYFLAGRLDSPIGYRNGTAALFAIAAWPLIGFAARRGVASGARAAAFATAVLVLGLVFLTQSRGVLIGFVLGGAVSLAIGPDRLRRAWLAIAAIAMVAIASGTLLTPYDAFDGGAGAASTDDIRTAAMALALLVAGGFLAGMFLFIFDNGLRSTGRVRVHVIASVALAMLAVGVGAAGLAKVGNPVSYVDSKLEEFNDVDAATTSGSTRLGSVSGQRSDLWGVAWDEFRADPLAGAGAGSYRFAYYRDRQTDRNLSDTHSLPLRLLADLGLIGTGLFAVWLGAIGVAIFRRAREAAEGDRVWVAGLAAAGVTVLAQCLADWLWLLPGLLGLCVLALGLAAGGEEVEQEAPLRRWSFGRIAATAALGAATISVAFLFLGNAFVRKARVDALSSPQAELDSARTAAWFNPVSVTALYLQASALESQGKRAEARQALEDALDLEPDNFVTLGLLGDFGVRGGNPVAARNYYRRALALNPQDVGLRELSRGS